MSGRRSSRRDGDGGSGRVCREDLDRLSGRVDRLHDLVDTTGRLALQTAHRVGSAAAQRGLVFFCKGSIKQDLVTAWTSWKTTSRLPPGERPSVRPTPWKVQVSERFLAYIMAGARDVADLGQHAEGLVPLSTMVEAISHGEPNDSDPWPIIVTFRNSEQAVGLREALLHERWRVLQGRDKELGWRPARHMASGPARAVLQGLGLEAVAAKENADHRSGKEVQRPEPSPGPLAVRAREGLRYIVFFTPPSSVLMSGGAAVLDFVSRGCRPSWTCLAEGAVPHAFGGGWFRFRLVCAALLGAPCAVLASASGLCLLCLLPSLFAAWFALCCSCCCFVLPLLPPLPALLTVLGWG